LQLQRKECAKGEAPAVCTGDASGVYMTWRREEAVWLRHAGWMHALLCCLEKEEEDVECTIMSCYAQLTDREATWDLLNSDGWPRQRYPVPYLGFHLKLYTHMLVCYLSVRLKPMKLPTKQLEVNHKASIKLTRETLVSSVWEVPTIPFMIPASWLVKGQPTIKATA
jgi:hypothetical protein